MSTPREERERAAETLTQLAMTCHATHEREGQHVTVSRTRLTAVGDQLDSAASLLRGDSTTGDAAPVFAGECFPVLPSSGTALPNETQAGGVANADRPGVGKEERIEGFVPNWFTSAPDGDCIHVHRERPDDDKRTARVTLIIHPPTPSAPPLDVPGVEEVDYSGAYQEEAAVRWSNVGRALADLVSAGGDADDAADTLQSAVDASIAAAVGRGK